MTAEHRNNRTTPPRRACVGVLLRFALLLLLSAAPVLADDEEESLPQFEDLTIPTAEQLLEEPPRDWIVLKTGEVLFVEPLSPVRTHSRGWKTGSPRNARSGRD